MALGSLLSALVRKTVNTALPYARQFAEANMTSTVRLNRAVLPVFNPVTGVLSMPPESVVYEGPAHVYTVTGPLTMQLGEEPQYYSTTFVTLPQQLQTQPKIDDIVTVLASDDASLVNRQFRVGDVSGGGVLPAATKLEVTGLQPSQTWEG